jgi:hypothetical protein
MAITKSESADESTNLKATFGSKILAFIIIAFR